MDKLFVYKAQLMSRLLIASLLLVALLLPMHTFAQVKEVTVHVVTFSKTKGMTDEKLKKEKPLNGAVVLAFNNPGRAKEFYNKLMKNEVSQSEYSQYADYIKETDNGGMVMFNMNSNGVIVVENPFSETGGHEIYYLQGRMSC